MLREISLRFTLMKCGARRDAMHDAVEVDEYEKRCQLREDRDRPGTCGRRTAGPRRRRHFHSLSRYRTSRADLLSRGIRGREEGGGVQCPV